MQASQSGRSRLDPEPIPRRDFLGLAAVWSAISAFVLATLGILRLPKAAVLPTPTRKFRVVIPETLAPGEPFVPPGRSVVLFRDGEGVYAVSTVCTHLGCIVKAAPGVLDCPCHGSRFDLQGTVLRGPAPSPLPWLEVTRLGESAFVVDEGMSVPRGTKVRA
ncbi:MAG TPA: Rieske 2Fe-2S domain-containing protein [Acidobacteriota bacterium]|nr:Rieske 2Fe-2S domain-containing protein [Acidobacteriota bacterium]